MIHSSLGPVAGKGVVGNRTRLEEVSLKTVCSVPRTRYLYIWGCACVTRRDFHTVADCCRTPIMT